MIRRTSGLVLAAQAALAACAPAAPFQARFAVRGRWPGERAIAYEVRPEDGALEPAEFTRAIESALAQWQATGCAAFHAARAGETPLLTFAWKRGAHGECVPFGVDPGVAHAGPVGPGTFVHFDAARDWSDSGLSLAQAALHEVGHVLGLDHSPDERDAMYPEPSRARARLAPGDLAGIHSLYGGGAEARGDLVVTSGARELVLRSIAPPGLVDWALFDTDGDGDAEIVTWRTDAPGQGALWSYHFAPGPVLERTLGPLYGLAGPGLELELLRTPDGERLLILQPERGVATVRRFDDRGIPQTFEGEPPMDAGVGGAGAGPVAADLDHDGRAESVARRD